MASKVPWSRQEAAILLDGYIKLQNGGLPRLRIIKQVSIDLRKMAVNNGVEIDDIFRNENGISFQMQSMESAYCGRTVTKPATLLFKEIVALYRDNYAEYETLLKEARAVIDGQINFKDGFASWLSSTIPTVQVNTMLSLCSKIEEFCLKLKVLKAPLFETTNLDTLNLVNKTVSRNKIFRIINKKQLKHIDTVMAYLLRYVREGNLDKGIPTLTTAEEAIAIEKPQETPEPYVRTEQDRRLIAKYPLVYKRIFTVLFDNKELRITIANLYERINHIARCADIEDILDNVSWSICKGDHYTFSEEIAHHDDPVEAAKDTAKFEDAQSKIEMDVVDFNHANDYSYTKPVSISYFGDKTVGLTSWTDFYVKFVSILYDDYAHVIPVGKSFTGSGRVDFGNKDVARTMTAPKPIHMQMFLETNLSASDIVGKVKALLDICRVDYENVVIEYQKRSDIAAMSRVTVSQNKSVYFGRIDSSNFTIFLRDHEGMADNTCRSYASAISFAERFAKEHHLEHFQLFTSDWQEAKATVDALFENPIFIKYNNQQHNRFRAATKKLMLFLRSDAAGETPGKIISDSAVQPVADEKFLNVLIQDFRKGFRLESPIELRKFRRCYEQIYKVALEDDDAAIERKISSCGILVEDKVFVPQVMLGEDSREGLFEYIRKSFDEGKTAIYYQALFNEFTEDFLDSFIYNADMLKEYLAYMLKNEYFFGRSYLSKEADTASAPIDEIRTCLKEYAAPMAYDAIFENLTHIPQQKIKQILATNAEFINNSRGEYFHVSAVHFSDEELDNISEIITVAIEDKEFLSGNELVDAIKSKYPYTYEKNSAFSMVGLRDSIKYHLGHKFSFSGNIISKIGSSLTMSDVFANYCRGRDSFTLDELNVLAGELGTVIYFDPVYENSLRISNNRFVSKARAHFLVTDTDAALDRFCTGDYISIGKVSEFSLFPNAGFPWNEYLLEHYVAMYSDKYSLYHIGFNANKCVGVIAKKSAGFESFDDCITKILADSNIILRKEPALQYLCDEGYIARRIYTNIEELLIRATAQRNRKEAN